MNENQGKGGQELSQDDIDRLINGDVGLSDDKGKDASQDKLAEEWAQALEAGEDIQEGKPLGKSAERASFEELQQGRPANGSADLDFILDIPLEVTVEMGRTRMLIHDLLQLGQGSVIELNRLAGEPLDILVNNKLVARGEVVVVGEKFGIRLTDIVSPMERVKRLR
ncbi:MAG TPA: flagellar motor switch protein FliN [Deltaproteobacteria bacterium]|jgi:flagellar motor switch protein FliN/FliY|nr:flagellar motor switch protein FliN [Deltaproteobacteria bacterium]HQJ09212.1 flagellar motor switch protein FliN [Deltaproteobacteria bacterium]